LKPKGEDCPFLSPPRASGASEAGAVVAPAWEQGAEATPHPLRGGDLSPCAYAPAQGCAPAPVRPRPAPASCSRLRYAPALFVARRALSVVRPPAPLSSAVRGSAWGEGGGHAPTGAGGRVRGTPCPLHRVRTAPCPPPACSFQPPKEAKSASDFPSSKDRLTVSGGFAHARGACLPLSLNTARAFAFGEEKISRRGHSVRTATEGSGRMCRGGQGERTEAKGKASLPSLPPALSF